MTQNLLKLAILKMNMNKTNNLRIIKKNNLNNILVVMEDIMEGIMVDFMDNIMKDVMKDIMAAITENFEVIIMKDIINLNLKVILNIASVIMGIDIVMKAEIIQAMSIAIIRAGKTLETLKYKILNKLFFKVQ